MKKERSTHFLSLFNRPIGLMIMLAILISLMGCPAKQPMVEMYSPARISYLTAEVPAWLMELPQGDYAIGIAWRPTLFDGDSEDSARDFAAVSMSRNHSAYVVDKSLVYSLSQMEEIDWNNVNFNVVVSADTTYLRKAAEELIMLDSVEVHGFVIGLFGFHETEIDKTLRMMQRSTMPAWCEQTHLTISGESVYITGTALSANLIDAWQEAQETALRTIARYRVQRVVSRILTRNDWLHEFTQMETVLRNQRVYLSRSFIEFRHIADQPSYRVYLQFRADR